MQRIPKKSTLTGIAFRSEDGLTPVHPSSTVLDARYGSFFSIRDDPMGAMKWHEW
jgi:hypothetical protein